MDSGNWSMTASGQLPSGRQLFTISIGDRTHDLSVRNFLKEHLFAEQRYLFVSSVKCSASGELTSELIIIDTLSKRYAVITTVPYIIVPVHIEGQSLNVRMYLDGIEQESVIQVPPQLLWKSLFQNQDSPTLNDRLKKYGYEAQLAEEKISIRAKVTKDLERSLVLLGAASIVLWIVCFSGDPSTSLISGVIAMGLMIVITLLLMSRGLFRLEITPSTMTVGAYRKEIIPFETIKKIIVKREEIMRHRTRMIDSYQWYISAEKPGGEKVKLLSLNHRDQQIGDSDVSHVILTILAHAGREVPVEQLS